MNPPRSETLARERGQVTNLAGTTAKGDEPDLVILGGGGGTRRAKTDRGTEREGKDRQGTDPEIRTQADRRPDR